MVRNPQDSHHQRVSCFLATLWHENTLFQVGWLFEFLKFICLCGVSDVFSLVSVGLNFKGTQARNIALKPAAGVRMTKDPLWWLPFSYRIKMKRSQRLPLQISSKNIKGKCLEIGKKHRMLSRFLSQNNARRPLNKSVEVQSSKNYILVEVIFEVFGYTSHFTPVSPWFDQGSHNHPPTIVRLMVNI